MEEKNIEKNIINDCERIIQSGEFENNQLMPYFFILFNHYKELYKKYSNLKPEDNSEQGKKIFLADMNHEIENPINFTAPFERIAEKDKNEFIFPEYLKNIKILIVDSNPTFLSVLENILISFSFNPKSVDSSEKAINELKNAPLEESYRLIFIDLKLKGTDGITLSKKIRDDSLLCSIPIIMMTSFSSDEIINKAKELNVKFIRKPINRSSLFDTLIEVFECKMFLAQSKGLKHEEDKKLFSNIPGIDIEDGIKRLGGNSVVFIKLLKSFEFDYSNVVNDIKNAISCNDIEYALRLVHTLKGISGNLSAKELHEASKALEKALKENLEIKYLSLINELEIALNRVKIAINILTNGEANTNNIENKSLDLNIITPLFKKLYFLLQTRDIDAEECMDEIKKYWTSFHQKKELDILEKQIFEYEFEEAVETLEQIFKNFNISVAE
ncbi:MAG: response regulator [Desulfobacterales bacterium]|nr:response regulator [Desulfobacterales bacterium]